MPMIDLTAAEREALAYIAGRELAENRYPFAPHLAPLRSGFKKLAPTTEIPPPPSSRPLAMKRRRR